MELRTRTPSILERLAEERICERETYSNAKAKLGMVDGLLEVRKDLVEIHLLCWAIWVLVRIEVIRRRLEASRVAIVVERLDWGSGMKNPYSRRTPSVLYVDQNALPTIQHYRHRHNNTSCYHIMFIRDLFVNTRITIDREVHCLIVSLSSSIWR